MPTEPITPRFTRPPAGAATETRRDPMNLMSLKAVSLRLAGGLLALGIAATAMAGHAPAAHADSPQKPGVFIEVRPDLTVSELKVNKVVNHLIIQVTIMNNSSDPANQPFRTDINVNGQVVKSFYEAGLPGGNGRYYVFDMIVPQTLTKATVTATVDAGFQVPESNESNNIAAQVLTF
jgi:hypothetical protein